MRLVSVLSKVVAISALFFGFVTPGRADRLPVRGGSQYGDNSGLSGCVAKIADFQNTDVADNCEAFTLTTFSIGGNTYSGALFAFLEPGGSSFGILDIIQLAGGSSLTLNLLNASAPTGVFMCGSFDLDSSEAVPSSGPSMSGLPCTTGSSPNYSGDLDLANVQANFSATGVTFVNGTSSPIAVFTEDGNIQGATGVPEPASLMLLGVGLLAIGGKFRRVK
jgi:hypothetical protein